MIDAKELRIGNFVECDGYMGKYVSKILAIDIANNIGVLDSGVLTWLGDKTDNINPLSITEDLLFDLGFKRHPVHQNDFIKHTVRLTHVHLTGNFVFNFEHQIIYINALHQLMNLYFSLTNKELEYKL